MGGVGGWERGRENATRLGKPSETATVYNWRGGVCRAREKKKGESETGRVGLLGSRRCDALGVRAEEEEREKGCGGARPEMGAPKKKIAFWVSRNWVGRPPLSGEL